MRKAPQATRHSEVFLNRNPYLQPGGKPRLDDREIMARKPSTAATALALTTTLLASLVAPVSAQDVVPAITEFMADNGGSLATEAGSHPRLDRDPQPRRHHIRARGLAPDRQQRGPYALDIPRGGVTIEPGAYLLVYASGEDIIGPAGNTTPISNSSTRASTWRWYRPDGTIQQEFAPAYPRQYTDISYGLAPGEASLRILPDTDPGGSQQQLRAGLRQGHHLQPQARIL